MVKLPDDAIFEQFNRRFEDDPNGLFDGLHDADDFDGLAKEIAERLRAGIDEAGAKWVADLFDPSESKLPYEVTISRRQGYTREREKERDASFYTFSDAYYSVGQDIDKAVEKVQQKKWQGGPGWHRDTAYKYRKMFLEYLEASRG